MDLNAFIDKYYDKTFLLAKASGIKGMAMERPMKLKEEYKCCELSDWHGPHFVPYKDAVGLFFNVIGCGSTSKGKKKNYHVYTQCTTIPSLYFWVYLVNDTWCVNPLLML